MDGMFSAATSLSGRDTCQHSWLCWVPVTKVRVTKKSLQHLPEIEMRVATRWLLISSKRAYLLLVNVSAYWKIQSAAVLWNNDISELTK